MQLIIITGQTATGKTKLALEFAKKYNGELINCDSRQIYQQLNIISGKDLARNSKFKSQLSKSGFNIGYYLVSQQSNNRTTEQSNNFLKIWLYDIIKPNQYFSSYDWVNCALPVIKNIYKRGKTPIIVGGTYHYLYHLLYQVKTASIPPNWRLRTKLKHLPVSLLQNQLKQLNRHLFNQLNSSDRSNPHRLIRKIEIAISGQSLFLSRSLPFIYDLPHKLNFSAVDLNLIGLAYKNKNDLIAAVKNRVNQRLSQGALKEIDQLIANGYQLTDFGLNTIGYRQLFAFRQNKVSLSQATDQWITAELQYAKRQLSFMKKDPRIVWQWL